MPDWIINSFGPSFGPIVWVAIVGLLVCLLAMAMIVLGKKAFGGRIGVPTRGRTPRLGVMDVARVDDKRRLVLVRRDDVEHLILVGGDNDVLIEGNILRVPASRQRRDWPEVEEDQAAEAAAREPTWLTAALEVAGQRLPGFQATRTETPETGTPRDEPQVEIAAEERPAEPASLRAEPVAKPAEARQPPAARPSAAAPDMATEARGANLTARPEPGRRDEARPAAVRPAERPAQPVAPQSEASTPEAEQRPAKTFSFPRVTPAPAPSGTATSRPTAPRADTPVARPVQEAPAPGGTATAARGEAEAPNSEGARLELRQTMNRAQSPSIGSVRDASTSAAATPPREPRPLSVRSFATAIQNRKAPAEMPQPTGDRERDREPAPEAPQAARPVPATPVAPASPATAEEPREMRNPAPARQPAPAVSAPAAPHTVFRVAPDCPEPAETARQDAHPEVASRSEPSLEDFLSAELDSDFGDDSFFRAHEAAEPEDSKIKPLSWDHRPARESGAETPRETQHQAEEPVHPAAEAAPVVEPEPREQPAPAAPSRSAPRIVAEREASRSFDRRPAGTREASRSQRLTLEEEMERLLGDFSFGGDGNRKSS